jgi:hypothetical protein
MIRGTGSGAIVFFFFAAAMFGISSGADSSEQPLSFSNKDLESYENPADRTNREPQPPGPERSGVKKAKVEDSGEQREKEYWCRKASPLTRKIRQLGEEIREKEVELREENASVDARKKKTQTLHKELAGVRKRLKAAEGNFSDLADEAHRKGVPQGWLRCQFE